MSANAFVERWRGAHRQVLSGSRVLLVINELRWFFSHRIGLARAVRDEGAEVIVAAPASELVQRVRDEGFQYCAVDLPRNLNSVSTEMRAPFGLARLYRQLRPDLVHHVTTKPVLYGSFAARLTGVPAVVNTVAGLGYVFMSNDARARALRRGVRAAYRIALGHPNSTTIFQNGEDRQAFLDSGLVAESRAALVRGSGVDVQAFRLSPEPADIPVVALVSRMLWDKGVGDFVDAARILQRRGVKCRCVLVGSPDPGNPTSIPDAVLEGWSSDGIVEWWGESTDVPAVMAISNLVVLPSYREGLPKVLLEAAASGRAVVTNDVPGCRDALEPGRTGLLVPPRQPGPLADAIEELLSDAPRRMAMGQRGRVMVEQQFSEEIVIEQTLQIYCTLLRRTTEQR